MVGPRGGSPYSKRAGGRVSKQQYYQQAIAAQQAQAAAAAASYHQQQQQQQQQQQAVAAVAAVESLNKSKAPKSAPAETEDSKAVMSLRETAMVRYIQYREWMELVIGTATEKSLYVLPSTEVQVSAVEIGSKDESSNPKARSAFYTQAAESLRNELLGKNANGNLEKKPHPSEEELREKFGLEISEQVKVKRVVCDLGLPKPAECPPQEILEAQLAKYEAAKAAKALTEETAMALTADELPQPDAEMEDAAKEAGEEQGSNNAKPGADQTTETPDV